MTAIRDLLRPLPKVSLHDHLDGGLRPSTILELADDIGRPLPASDPAALRDWFFEAASSGSLPLYLQTFDHTVAVLQTAEALSRVASEYVLDLADDGVVYAETRWAPEQHLAGGLSMEAAVEAVADGLARGMADAARAGRRIDVRQILCSMRHNAPTTRIAELAVASRDVGVVGFDIAGAEDGFAAERFSDAYALVHAAGMRATAHAGEAAGVPSIRGAIRDCHADRLGHGVRIVEDIHTTAGASVLGELAAQIRDEAIQLEVCPTSNVQTGICADIASHPFAVLADLGFTVTVNCDNRLQSRTTLTEEFARLSEAFGYGVAAVERFTLDAMRAAFCDLDTKKRLVADVIRPAYDGASRSWNRRADVGP